MTQIDLTAAIEEAAEALFDYNTTQGLHFVIHHTESGDGYAEIARTVVDAAAPLIARAERERILGTEEETGIFDRYEVQAFLGGEAEKPMHLLYCRRCHHVMIVARDMDGDQSGVTLAELAETAMEHEQEDHADGGTA